MDLLKSTMIFINLGNNTNIYFYFGTLNYSFNNISKALSFRPNWIESGFPTDCQSRITYLILLLFDSKNSFDNAVNKLADAKRYGDTLIGKAEKIRELGARNAKLLPKDLVDALPDVSEEEN
jgi:hypothetical protein